MNVRVLWLHPHRCCVLIADPTALATAFLSSRIYLLYFVTTNICLGKTVNSDQLHSATHPLLLRSGWGQSDLRNVRVNKEKLPYVRSYSEVSLCVACFVWKGDACCGAAHTPWPTMTAKPNRIHLNYWKDGKGTSNPVNVWSRLKKHKMVESRVWLVFYQIFHCAKGSFTNWLRSNVGLPFAAVLLLSKPAEVRAPSPFSSLSFILRIGLMCRLRNRILLYSFRFR